MVNKQIWFLAYHSVTVYLVPVSIKNQKTGIISGLAGLQSFNSLSQFILNHLQTNKYKR